MLGWLRRGLEALLALAILFEEWGWEPLQRLAARIAQLPPLAWLERRIAALPPYGALAVLLLSTVALAPVKIAALWLIGAGRGWLGLSLIVVTKVVGTALLARLFELTRPALMRLGWFARLYGRWSVWKAGIVVRVRASAVWRAAGLLKRRLTRWRDVR
jgi:hypothetical protein